MKFRFESSEVPMFEIDASGEILRCTLSDVEQLVEMAQTVTELRPAAPQQNVTEQMGSFVRGLESAVRLLRKRSMDDPVVQEFLNSLAATKSAMKHRILAGTSSDHTTILLIFTKELLAECDARVQIRAPLRLIK